MSSNSNANTPLSNPSVGSNSGRGPMITSYQQKRKQLNNPIPAPVKSQHPKRSSSIASRACANKIPSQSPSAVATTSTPSRTPEKNHHGRSTPTNRNITPRVGINGRNSRTRNATPSPELASIRQNLAPNENTAETETLSDTSGPVQNAPINKPQLNLTTVVAKVQSFRDQKLLDLLLARKKKKTTCLASGQEIKSQIVPVAPEIKDLTPDPTEATDVIEATITQPQGEEDEAELENPKQEYMLIKVADDDVAEVSECIVDILDPENIKEGNNIMEKAEESIVEKANSQVSACPNATSEHIDFDGSSNIINDIIVEAVELTPENNIISTPDARTPKPTLDIEIIMETKPNKKSNDQILNDSITDFQSFLDKWQKDPRFSKTFFLELDEEPPRRLPTNSPSSSLSASTLATYQHFENLRILIQSKHLLKRIKSHSSPNHKSANRGSSPSVTAGTKKISDEDLCARKVKWLLLRNGITLPTNPSNDSTIEKLDCVEIGAGNACTSSSFIEEIGLDSVEAPVYYSAMDSSDEEASKNTTECVFDDGVAEVVPESEPESDYSPKSQFRWLDHVEGLTVHQRLPMGFSSCFGHEQPFFRNSILPSLKSTPIDPTLLYHIYYEDPFFGTPNIPFCTVHKTSSDEMDGNRNSITETERIVLDTGDRFKLFVKLYCFHPKSIADETASAATATGKNDIETDKNNVLIIECQGCSPDCSFHNAKILACEPNGNEVLGTASLLSTDSGLPLLLLHNSKSNQSFIGRSSIVIPNSSSINFFVYETPTYDKNCELENYSEEYFNEEKDGHCVGSILRVGPKEKNPRMNMTRSNIFFQEISKQWSSACLNMSNINTETANLGLMFATSINAETKALILGGALLINHELLLP